MERESRILSRLAGFLHHHLLGLIFAAYVLAAVIPGPGLWIHGSRAARLMVGGDEVAVTVSSLLLGFLLLSAGLRVRIEQLRRTLRRPRVVWVGLLANLGVPLAYVVLTA